MRSVSSRRAWLALIGVAGSCLGPIGLGEVAHASSDGTPSPAAIAAWFGDADVREVVSLSVFESESRGVPKDPASRLYCRLDGPAGKAVGRIQCGQYLGGDSFLLVSDGTASWESWPLPMGSLVDAVPDGLYVSTDGTLLPADAAAGEVLDGAEPTVQALAAIDAHLRARTGESPLFSLTGPNLKWVVLGTAAVFAAVAAILVVARRRRKRRNAPANQRALGAEE